jgi:hypothetical protein
MRQVPIRACCAALAFAALALPVTGCGGPGGGEATVPSLGRQASQPVAGAPGTGGRPTAAALHAAAQCIRQHGVPSYADPTLTPGGVVYTDQRSLQDAGPTALAAVLHACGTLITRAHFNPGYEPPAPPQFVQAGVRSAECLRAHGLPNVTDPTANSPYTPGHGFGFNRNEIPPGGKASPAWQRAYDACRAIIFAELRDSTLASLGSDG